MKCFEKYDIEYNNATAKGHGVYLYDYAQFSGAEKSYQVTQVSGRLGELVGTDDYKSNLKIQCIFGIISSQFMSHVTVIKRWLTGTGILKISHEPGDMPITEKDVQPPEYALRPHPLEAA